MKRTVAIIAGVVSMGVLAYVGSRLWAQPAGQPVAPAQTKIAVVNVSKAIKDYDKWKAYREEIRAVAKQYEENAKAMKPGVIMYVLGAGLYDPDAKANGKLTDQQIADIVAYLQTLK